MLKVIGKKRIKFYIGFFLSKPMYTYRQYIEVYLDSMLYQDLMQKSHAQAQIS